MMDAKDSIPISISSSIVYRYCCLHLCIWPLISLQIKCCIALPCRAVTVLIMWSVLMWCDVMYVHFLCVYFPRFSRAFLLHCFVWKFGFVYLFVVYVAVVVVRFILDLLVVILKQLRHLCSRGPFGLFPLTVFFFCALELSFKNAYIQDYYATHQVLSRLICVWIRSAP